MPASRLPAPLHTSEPLLLLADSFRARREAGVTQVRGFALHLERFRSAVVEVLHDSNIDSNAVAGGDIDAFLREATARIAEAGEGFPRLELWAAPDGPALSVALRALPPLTTEIKLRTSPVPESVATPARKGPNIATYGALARALGGEALLLDADGAVVEGTTTALVWWDDLGHGFVSASKARVPSVAEALIARIAGSLGATLSPAHATPEELAASDVWAVNALHGIRPVLSIDGVPVARQDPDRLSLYRAAFDGLWEPVRDERLV